MFYQQRRSVCLYLAVIMAFCGILAGFDQFEPSFAMSTASDDVRVEQSIASLSEKLLCTSETKGSSDIVRSLEKNHQVSKRTLFLCAFCFCRRLVSLTQTKQSRITPCLLLWRPSRSTYIVPTAKNAAHFSKHII